MLCSFSKIKRYMQNNASAPPPANVNANARLPQQQYNSKLEAQYNALAQKIAENSGIKIQGKIDVDILAKSTADFFAKKNAMSGASRSFQALGQSWKERIYNETNPEPLKLAMGGSLFASSKNDSIKIPTKELDEKVKREFCSIFKSLNASIYKMYKCFKKLSTKPAEDSRKKSWMGKKHY